MKTVILILVLVIMIFALVKVCFSESMSYARKRVDNEFGKWSVENKFYGKLNYLKTVIASCKTNEQLTAAAKWSKALLEDYEAAFIKVMEKKTDCHFIFMPVINKFSTYRYELQVVENNTFTAINTINS